MNFKKITLLLGLSFFILFQSSFAQSERFKDEVAALSERIEKEGWEKGSILFTGSSSVRFWQSLQEDFPDQKIINTGFGGSQASDLIAYLPQLVLKYSPSKVFIYEGDNDLWAKKEVAEIMGDLDQIVKWIKKENPQTEIYLISAKPSPSRWDLKLSYLALNSSMKQYATSNEGVNFVNVWDIMLDEKGQAKSDIFISDELHMNAKGYALWKEVFQPFVRN